MTAEHNDRDTLLVQNARTLFENMKEHIPQEIWPFCVQEGYWPTGDGRYVELETGAVLPIGDALEKIQENDNNGASNVSYEGP